MRVTLPAATAWAAFRHERADEPAGFAQTETVRMSFWTVSRSTRESVAGAAARGPGFVVSRW